MKHSFKPNMFGMAAAEANLLKKNSVNMVHVATSAITPKCFHCAIQAFGLFKRVFYELMPVLWIHYSHF